jgi:hypothetical protein
MVGFSQIQKIEAFPHPTISNHVGHCHPCNNAWVVAFTLTHHTLSFPLFHRPHKTSVIFSACAYQPFCFHFFYQPTLESTIGFLLSNNWFKH